MHGEEEKNEGRDSGELVRMEKRKFAGDNVLGEVVDKQAEKQRRYGHLHLFIPSIDRRLRHKSE